MEEAAIPGKLFNTNIGYFSGPCTRNCSRMDFFRLCEIASRPKEQVSNVFWFELAYLHLTWGNRGQGMISEIQI